MKKMVEGKIVEASKQKFIKLAVDGDSVWYKYNPLTSDFSEVSKGEMRTYIPSLGAPKQVVPHALEIYEV